MPIVSLNVLLRRAREGGYAVGYFESWNLESTKAVVSAAEQSRSPVVIGFNGGILTDEKRMLPPEDLEIFGCLGLVFAEKASVPVALLLNEIQSLELAVRGIRYGFNALMFETEGGDAEDHIERTRRIVETAHAAGVSVESNVGVLPSAEKSRSGGRGKRHGMTSPREAARFVERTGVDALGVSIGNVEVLMEGKARLDFGLLREIHRAVDAPLVVHGGTGIDDGDVPALVAGGVCKMNLGAALNRAYIDGMKHSMNETGAGVSPKYAIGSGLAVDMTAHAETAMQELVKHKMTVYGSAGKAQGPPVRGEIY
jgi:ketose-bisphosphate aldolase